MARDKVKRNVVALCSVPQGRGGRPSKSLTLAQAEGVLRSSEGTRMRLILTCRSRYAAEQHRHRRLTHCADTNIPELRRLGSTIDVRRSGLLAYFDTGGESSGPTEAMNSLIKKVKRVGHGLQLHQLPAPAPTALRHPLADSPTSTNQRPTTPLGCVEAV